MSKWHVRMTFAGDVEAATTAEAGKEFKRLLGVAPESMRPEASMVDFQARLISQVSEFHDAIVEDL